MILGGRLARASSSAEGPRFTIKGAVALEMRLPSKARATKDLDLILDDVGEDGSVGALRMALDGGYQGFAFRVKNDPHVMPNDAVRVDVALAYRGRGWGTIQVDLSPGEGDFTEVEMVEPLRLDPFGLDTPRVLPCLSLRYHLAQKIHAMTEPPVDEETPNERFRDLVDVLLMSELATDLGGVRAACREVFEVRARHEWPPFLDPPGSWEGPFAALAEQVHLPLRTLRDAVEEARAFIQAIVVADNGP
ncbi:MAG: nucleotidyl transferase AbiEii/AbiGii toxin family protein [Gemmatimonadota bacterium]